MMESFGIFELTDEQGKEIERLIREQDREGLAKYLMTLEAEKIEKGKGMEVAMAKDAIAMFESLRNSMLTDILEDALLAAHHYMHERDGEMLERVLCSTAYLIERGSLSVGAMRELRDVITIAKAKSDCKGNA